MAADDSAARMARALYEARDKRVPIAPLTDADPTMGMDDGYIVQREFTSLLVADGDSVIGYKAGLTSAPMQDMFGVSTPDYGPVMASTIRGDGATVSLDDVHRPEGRSGDRLPAGGTAARPRGHGGAGTRGDRGRHGGP